MRKSDVRAWIEYTETEQPDGVRTHMWVICKEVLVGRDETGAEIWKAHGDHTGHERAKYPNGLMAYIEMNEWQFMRDRSHWWPPAD